MTARKNIDDQVRKFAAKGMTADRIAELLHCSDSHVRNTARNIGVTLTRKKRVYDRRFDDRQFIDAASAGLTVAEAASQIGCDVATVRLRARELNLKFKPVLQPRNHSKPKPVRVNVAELRNKPQSEMTLADYAAIENAAMRARDGGKRMPKFEKVGV